MSGKRRDTGGRESFRNDDRGVSVTVNYALNLMVATLLIAGVLTATGGMVEDRRESAARSELSVLGERIAGELMAADRLAVVGDGPNEVVELTVALPDRVAGSRYEVSIGTSSDEIILETENLDVSVTVGYRTETDVAEVTVRGGDMRIELNTGGTPDPSDDELEVSRA